LSGFREVVTQGDFPARHDHGVACLVSRNADLDHLPLVWPAHPKFMQMVIQPAHGILERHMQIPEAVRRRHLEPPPNGGLDFQKGDFELIDQTVWVGCHGC
jgi:hypothetical protein